MGHNSEGNTSSGATRLAARLREAMGPGYPIALMSGRLETFMAGVAPKAIDRTPVAPKTGDMAPVSQRVATYVRAVGADPCSPTPKSPRWTVLARRVVTVRNATLVYSRF